MEASLSHRRALLVGSNALLLLATFSAIGDSKGDIALALGLASLLFVTILMYVFRHDKKLLAAGAPRVHFQIPVQRALNVPLVAQQIGLFRTVFIYLASGGFLCGYVLFGSAALRFEPDWAARKDGCQPFTIPLDAISHYERKHLSGQVVDSFYLFLRSGDTPRFEIRQPDFVEARLRTLGLTSAAQTARMP